MRAKMSKMMSGAFATAAMAAVLAMSLTAGPAGAVVGNAGLAQALTDGDLVQLAQQKKKRKGSKSSTPKLSKDHQDKIRQHVPAEYHQYIPGMGGGGGGGAGGAGAGGGIPGVR
jgi:hypothetical protein